MITVLLSLAACATTPEPAAQEFHLKDGTHLFLHPDGTMRMVDQHGKPMTMSEGVEMELQDGTMIMMKNRHIWRTVGSKGQFIHSVE
jgi:hypothetical protein